MELTPEMSGVFTSLEAKGVKICVMCDFCFPKLSGVDFGKKFSAEADLVASFDRYGEDFQVEIDTPHRNVACLTRRVGDKNRYMFVNSANEPTEINCSLKNTGNARLFCPLEKQNRSCRTSSYKERTRYEFTLGAYEVLIITE